MNTFTHNRIQPAGCSYHCLGFSEISQALGHSHQKGSRKRSSRSLRPSASLDSAEIQRLKEDLQIAVADTQRGGVVSKYERGVIEEAQLSLEWSKADLDYALLEGLWRLIYTTALDVAPLLTLGSNPFIPLQVGNIYQRFSSTEEGKIENIITFSVPFLLNEGDGARLVVGAEYEVRSPRRIALRFQEVGLGNIHISPALETLLAPALLPRGWINHRILLAIQELNVKVPIMSVRDIQGQSDGSLGSGGAGVGDYYLTFLDEDMLIGRAQNSRGTFIFVRETAE